MNKHALEPKHTQSERGEAGEGWLVFLNKKGLLKTSFKSAAEMVTLKEIANIVY